MRDLAVWQVVFLTLLSLAVGVLGGTVGLSLGTVRLPFLLLLGIPAPIAGGTNILVSTLSAGTGAYRHLREERVDWTAALVQGLPAMVGALAGGLAAGTAPEAVLVAITALLVVWQGIELGLRARRPPPVPHAPVARAADLTTRPRWGASRLIVEGAIGFAIGVLGGAVGLILGTLRLPALIAVLDLDPRIAAGTNLVVGVWMGVFGWVGHVVHGQVDYALLALMGASGMVGAYWGARLTARIARERLLLLMGGVLTSVGLVLLLNVGRQLSS